MPNKAIPEIKLQLDKERILRLDLNAMEAFEETTGVSLINPECEDPKDPGSPMKLDKLLLSAKGIKTMLWACLLHEDPALTLAEAGKLVHMGNLRTIDRAIQAAWQVAMPEKPEGEPDSPPV